MYKMEVISVECKCKFPYITDFDIIFTEKIFFNKRSLLYFKIVSRFFEKLCKRDTLKV